MFMMIGYLLGSSLIIIPGRGAENMGWLAILLGIGESLIFAWIYTTLILRFPRKTLVEITEIVYGKIIGKLVALVFIYYLFHLGSFVVRNFLDFIKLSILPETPVSVILLVGLITCGYGARKGLEVMGRVGEILTIVSTLLFLSLTAMLVLEFHPENFLPLFSVPAKKIFWAAHGAATFPFGQSVIFVMVLPFLNQQKEVRSTVFKTIFFTGLLLLLAGVRTYGILGKTSEVIVYPSFYVTKMINFGQVFTRMDIIFAANILVLGYVRISTLIYATSLGTAQIFHLSDFRQLVFPLGVLMFLIAMMNFANVAENTEFATYAYPIYSLPFIIGIPLLTLLIALLRGLPKRSASK
jgi:spore germination protein KB